MRRPRPSEEAKGTFLSTPQHTRTGDSWKNGSYWGAALSQRKAVLVVCLLVAAGLTRRNNLPLIPATVSTSGTVRSAADTKNKCTVWLAPSSLKGYSGYGIFTTRDIPKGGAVLGGPDGLSIPIQDYLDTKQANKDAKKAWIDVWDNYWWGRGVPDHVNYFAGTDVVDYQIAFGALPNHHCLLDSLHSQYPKPPFMDGLVDRFKDPSAGAFTYSRGREFLVNRDIKSGEELFLSYGYCRHDDEDIPDWTSRIFMEEDFSAAVDMIQNGLDFDIQGALIVPTSSAPLAAELLPKSRKELDEMLAKAKSKKERIHYLATHQGLNMRTPEWIRANGMCMENMIPKQSTISAIGQGGFAQFPIRKGELVTPAPLLQILDRSALDLYDSSGKKSGTQLLLNYCFGHCKSTLLLCPDTNAVLINHCSSRSNVCSSQGPNADYRWSTGWDPTSDDWRKKSLQELALETGRGLALEIFATRDILPGEEVFIDYGPEFELAWNQHVRIWKPPPPPQGPWITAQAANDSEGPIFDFLVTGNLRRTTQHPYLFTGCQYWPTSEDNVEAYRESNRAWTAMTDRALMTHYANSGSRYIYWDEEGYTNHADTSHWPCSVLRQEPNGKYVVRIHQNPWEDSLPWHQNSLPRLLHSYSRESIHYFVKPFSNDQQMPGAFRHSMMIRDGMFPAQWMNRKAD